MGLAAWGLAAAGLVVAVALAVAGRDRGIWGDEDTYIAMTASLARDGDLVFDERDLEWAMARPGGPPATLILQRVASGVSYSKPVVYPLLALPVYALLGDAGLVATNVLLAVAALLVGWLYLRRLGPATRAALTLLTFAVCGVLPFYLGWRMSDVAQIAFGLAGLALVASALRAPPGRRSLLGAAGGLLLGLLAAMRLPGLALAAAAVAGGVWIGRRRAAAAVALAALLGFGLASGAGLALAGSANPYKEVRASFNGETGYPVDGQRRLAAFRHQAGHPVGGLAAAVRLDPQRLLGALLPDRPAYRAAGLLPGGPGAAGRRLRRTRSAGAGAARRSGGDRPVLSPLAAGELLWRLDVLWQPLLSDRLPGAAGGAAPAAVGALPGAVLGGGSDRRRLGPGLDDWPWRSAPRRARATPPPACSGCCPARRRRARWTAFAAVTGAATSCASSTRFADDDEDELPPRRRARRRPSWSWRFASRATRCAW